MLLGRGPPRRPAVVIHSRIDHVLGKGAVEELDSKLIGDDPDNRSGTELWPTDHAGVVAKLQGRLAT